MSTLGYRELIINQDSRISGIGGAGALVTIESLGTFDPANMVLSANNVIPAEAAALGDYNITGLVLPAANPINEVVVTFYFGLPGRIVGEMFPEHEASVSYSFPAGTDATDITAAIIPGFNDRMLNVTSLSATSLNVVFQPGYEGMSISRATYTTYTGSGNVVVRETAATIVENTAPNPGLNTGKMLEQSVVLSTPENNPYGMNEYGHDQIDLRGTYTAYVIETVVPIDGWEKHSGMGSQDVNEKLGYTNTKYIIYANDVSAAAGNVLLAELVTP